MEKETKTPRAAEAKTAAPWDQVERLVMPVLGPCPVCFGTVKPCRCQLEKEVDRLNCNNISCHQGRDILASIYEAMAQLPCNGIQGILCGAAQEIQALREIYQLAKDWETGVISSNELAISVASALKA